MNLQITQTMVDLNKLDSEFEWNLEQEAGFLAFSIDDDIPSVWFLEEPDAPKITRRFKLVRTNDCIDDSTFVYLGTLSGRSQTYHLFEIVDDISEPTTS